MSQEQYTLVQHSGYGYGGNHEFLLAVESRLIRTAKDRQRVLDAGGVIFDTYGEAEDAAENENYPPDLDGIIPKVPGTFSVQKLDGLRIYVPKLREYVVTYTSMVIEAYSPTEAIDKAGDQFGKGGGNWEATPIAKP